MGLLLKVAGANYSSNNLGQVVLPITLDTDVSAFLTAAGLTGASTTLRYGLNDFVLGLKAAGIWAKIDNLYPFAGTSYNSAKINLKDPVNGTITGTFTDSYVATGQGFKFPSPTVNSAVPVGAIWKAGYTTNGHILVVHNDVEYSGDICGLCSMSYGLQKLFVSRNIGSSPYRVHASVDNNPSLANSAVNSEKGMLAGSVVAGDYTMYSRGVAVSTADTPRTAVDTDTIFKIGLENGSTKQNTRTTIGLISVGVGLTPTEIATYNTLINAFSSSVHGVTL